MCLWKLQVWSTVLTQGRQIPVLHLICEFTVVKNLYIGLEKNQYLAYLWNGLHLLKINLKKVDINFQQLDKLHFFYSDCLVYWILSDLIDYYIVEMLVFI